MYKQHFQMWLPGLYQGFRKLLIALCPLFYIQILAAQTFDSGSNPDLVITQLDESYFIYPDSFDASGADAFDLDDGRYFSTRKRLSYFTSGPIQTRIDYLELPAYYSEYPIQLGYSVSDSSHYEVYDTAGHLIFSRVHDSITLSLNSIPNSVMTKARLNPVLPRVRAHSPALTMYDSAGYNLITPSAGLALLSKGGHHILYALGGLSVLEYTTDVSGKVLQEDLQLFSAIGPDSMVLAYERRREPAILRSGHCAERVSVRRIEQYTYGNRSILPDLAQLTDLRAAQTGAILTKPGNRIMQAEALVYPNPGRERINVMKLEGASVMLISDLYGRLLRDLRMESGFQYLDVDVGDLEAGTYVLSLLNAQGETLKTEKWIKL